MATIWQKKIKGNRYEVRASRNTYSLYTNGVCHSEYNSYNISTGSYWDLLILPIFFYANKNNIKRILVLGVGGGAVINQIMSLMSPEIVVGIEVNPMHLYIARRFFEVERPEVKLIEADAVSWLMDYSDAPFDMIIEDMFTEKQKDPVRFIDANADWFELLDKNLSKTGILSLNFISRKELQDCGYFKDSVYKKKFQSVFQLTVPGLDNYIGIFLRQKVNTTELRNNLNQNPVFKKALQNRKLNYRIRNLRKL